MKELYKTMRQDNLSTTSKAITPPPPQLTGNKATRGILGVCMVLLWFLVIGACGSSEGADAAKPTTGKSDKTPTTDKDKTYTVTFDLNYEEATDTPPVAQTIKKGGNATEPTEPTRAKYKLTNWYTDTATKNVFAFTTPITADMTLYARWTPVYTVTFDGNGGIGTVAEQSIPKNGKATAPNATDNPTKDGYTFDGWYEKQDGSGTAFAFTTIITADMTLYARWTPVYTVTFDVNGGTADTAPDPQTIKKDDKATKPADPTKDGYTFDNWYTDDATTKVFAFTTPLTGDITLYAKWICPAREARKALTHMVPLYNQGKADAPYLPEKLLGTFTGGSGITFYSLSPNIPTAPEGKADQLPYISPFSHLPPPVDTLNFQTGGFEITPDYIDASFKHPTTSDSTVRISCYSVKEINDNLYFYYGKVRFLHNGRETEAFNKSMYAWTGINKNDPANKDALYGYMVSIQGNYLRPLVIYPFVGRDLYQSG